MSYTHGGAEAERGRSLSDIFTRNFDRFKSIRYDREPRCYAELLLVDILAVISTVTCRHVTTRQSPKASRFVAVEYTLDIFYHLHGLRLLSPRLH